jgi:hypothetical protein
MSSMRVLRVYTDTSVIGGCFDPEFSLWSNRLIQDFQQRRYIPVVSSIVATEIDSAPEQVRTKFAEILRLEPVFLDLTEEAVNLELGYKTLQIHSPQEVATYE